MSNLSKGSKKLLNAWAFYDWANSVYPLVISSAVFPIFYEALFLKRDHYIDAFGMNLKNTALISFITAAAFLVVAFISPLLSGIADYVGNKKSFMKFFATWVPCPVWVYIGSSSKIYTLVYCFIS
jgi:UMF1 family MFS transporter